MKHIIVTADDFGIAREVNEAVELAHTQGILTAASLMVGTAATQDAVARARRLPGLRVGLHLSLLETTPVSPRREIPDLVGPDGRFRTDMARAGANMFFRSDVKKQLAREIEAQFERYAATGLPLDHVNAHKHFHLHPTVASLLIKIGRPFGMRAVRIPTEPHVMVRAIDPKSSRVTSLVTAPFAAVLRLRLRLAGFRVPDHVFGLAWSGAMTEERIAALLVHPPQGVTEIYTHPATANRYPGSAPDYHYVEELAGLIAPSVRDAAIECGASWGGYADVA